jgi:hypothetical protein
LFHILLSKVLGKQDLNSGMSQYGKKHPWFEPKKITAFPACLVYET